MSGVLAHTRPFAGKVRGVLCALLKHPALPVPGSTVLRLLMSISEGLCAHCIHNTEKPRIYLTDRESDCFQLYMQGASFREAAQELDINWRTVHTHHKSIRKKMEVQSTSRFDFFKQAFRMNLVRMCFY